MKLISIFILLFLYNCAYSKDNILLGIGTEFEHRIGFSDFKNLPEVPNCCPNFDGYELNNFSFNTNLEWNNGNWGALIYLNYKSIESNFASFQEDLINIEGTAIKGVYKHQMDFDYSLFSTSILFKYIYKDLHISSGLALSFYNKINVYQAEKIVEPADKGVFNDTKTRTRNEWAGMYEINSISPSIAAMIELPLKANSNGSLFFVPYIKMLYGFQIADELNWNENIFSLGFNFKYDLFAKEEALTPQIEKKKSEIITEVKPIAYHLSLIHKSKVIFTNQIEFKCTEIEEHKYEVLDKKLELEEKSIKNFCIAQFDELKVYFEGLDDKAVSEIKVYLSKSKEKSLPLIQNGSAITINAKDFDYAAIQDSPLFAEITSKNKISEMIQIDIKANINKSLAKEIHIYQSNTASENEILLIKNDILEKISNKKSALLITNYYNFGLNLAKEIDSPKIQLKLMDSSQQKINDSQYQIQLEFEK